MLQQAGPRMTYLRAAVSTGPSLTRFRSWLLAIEALIARCSRRFRSKRWRSFRRANELASCRVSWRQIRGPPHFAVRERIIPAPPLSRQPSIASSRLNQTAAAIDKSVNNTQSAMPMISTDLDIWQLPFIGIGIDRCIHHRALRAYLLFCIFYLSHLPQRLFCKFHFSSSRLPHPIDGSRP